MQLVCRLARRVPVRRFLWVPFSLFTGLFFRVALERDLNDASVERVAPVIATFWLLLSPSQTGRKLN